MPRETVQQDETVPTAMPFLKQSWTGSTKMLLMPTEKNRDWGGHLLFMEV